VAGAGELLIRVEAAGVNYADTVRRWGDHYPIPTPLPFIAGGEIVGKVREIGAGVSRDWLGRTVLSAPPCGGYAELATVRESEAFVLPSGLHPHQGLALFIQGLSAALILKRAGQLQRGDYVFVEGAAGGVGSLGVQLARLYGAGTVIAAASTAEKREKVLQLGATHAIDYGAPGWSQELRRLGGDRGIDVVMEMTGAPVFSEVMGVLAPGGRVVVYGIASRKPYQIPSERLIAKGQSVVGFYLGLFLTDRELIDSLLNELAGFTLSGQLRAEIGGVFPFADAAQAHRLLESRQSAAKLVLVPNI
jgi:NADPH:quinone reductase